jgi:Replication-relaxation
MIDLWEHKYLATSQITRLHFEHRKRASRRLKKLCDDGLLCYFEKPARTLFEKSEYVYYLTAKSAALVAQTLDLPREQMKWRIVPPKSNRYMDHFSALNDFRIALKMAAYRHDLVYTFLPEYSLLQGKEQGLNRRIKAKGKGVAFVPDGVFCLYRNPVIKPHDSSQRKLLFFVEIDRGTETPAVVMQKITAYCQYFDTEAYKKYNSVFQEDFRGFRLLIVANQQERMKSLLQYVEQTNKKDIDFVWFSPAECIGDNLLTDAVWNVAHEEDLKSIMSQESVQAVKGGHIPPLTNPPCIVRTGVGTAYPHANHAIANNSAALRMGI